MQRSHDEPRLKRNELFVVKLKAKWGKGDQKRGRFPQRDLTSRNKDRWTSLTGQCELVGQTDWDLEEQQMQKKISPQNEGKLKFSATQKLRKMCH